MKLEVSGKNASLAVCRACRGCGEVLALGYILKAAGKDIIVVGATGCAEVFSTPYPLTAWNVPYIHVAFENAAAVASGVEAALKKLNKKTKVLAIAGDGGTFDIGFQALSGAVERGHDFTYICLDNQAYMNTGIQRSGATPKYAITTTTPSGKLMKRKPLPEIIASHGNVYVATANTSFPNDLMNKIKKGIEFKGPSYIQILCPCVPGWGYPPEKTFELGKLAYETNFYPLYEIENGIVKLNLENKNKKPVEEYLRLQKRFKHLFKKENIHLIKQIQQDTDKEFNKLIKNSKE